MANSETDPFKEFSIAQAANDKLLRGATEEVLLGFTDKLGLEEIESLDAGELAADIASYYNLTPEQTMEAFDLCEQLVIGEADHE